MKDFENIQLKLLEAQNIKPQILVKQKQRYFILVDKNISASLIWNLPKSAQIEIYYLFLASSSNLNLSYKIAKDAKLKVKTLVLAADNEKIDINSKYDFLGAESVGTLEAGIVLSSQAQVNFPVEFNIAATAVDSNTRVDLKLSLLGSKARGKLLPALKIAGSKLQTGHSASTWRLSPTEEFYLRSRGLSPSAILELWRQAAWAQFTFGLEEKLIKSWEKKIKQYYDKLPA